MLESLRDSTLKKRKQRLEKEEELRSKGRKKSRKRRVSVTVVEEPNSSQEVSLASGNPSGVVLEVILVLIQNQKKLLVAQKVLIGMPKVILIHH